VATKSTNNVVVHRSLSKSPLPVTFSAVIVMMCWMANPQEKWVKSQMMLSAPPNRFHASQRGPGDVVLTAAWWHDVQKR